MSWDIYGNSLRRGHCEVHPNVHEEYPCSLCWAEGERYEQEKRERKRYEKLQEEAYWEEEKKYWESVRMQELKTIYPAGDKDLITDKVFK